MTPPLDPAAPPTSWQHLARAVAAIRAGDRRLGRAEVEAALAATGRDARTLRLAARLLFVLHEYRRALALLDVAAATAGAEGVQALDDKLELAGRLGWYREARAAGDEALRRQPAAERSYRVAELLATAHDEAGALEHLGAALAAGAAGAPLPARQSFFLMKAADLLARAGRGAEAAQTLSRALALAPDVPFLRVQAARYLIDAGEFEAAEARLAEVIAPPEPVAAEGGSGAAHAEVAALTGAVRVVVPPGQEALIRRMVSPRLPPGWLFVNCQIDRDRLHAHYAAPSLRVSARLTLRHPGTSPTAAETTVRRTARFALGLRAVTRAAPAAPVTSEAIVAAAAALEAALEASVREHEAAFRWEGAIVDGERGEFSQWTAEGRAAGQALAGTLALWRGDLDGAARAAAAALELDEGAAAAWRLRGAVSVLRGAPALALPDLDRALRADARDAEAHVWRAEALLRRGELEAAAADVVRGGELAEDFSDYVAAQLVRALITATGGRPPSLPDHGLPAALAVLAPEGLEAFARRDPPAVAAALEAALRRLRGNRSTALTWVAPEEPAGPAARLRRLQAAPSPRGPSKAALFTLVHAGREAALAAIEIVHASYSGAPEPWCYHGEIHLYLGEYELARSCFQRALEISPRTRWAYIGLGGVEVMEERPAEALAVMARGVEAAGGTGPTLHAYRGEARRLLGDLDGAREDLGEATRTKTTRVGAWINLALVEGARGDPAAEARVIERLREVAPALVSEAAEGLDVIRSVAGAWERPAAALSPPERRALLEAMRACMRGNRASACPAYLDREGALRGIAPAPAFTAETDAADLARVREAVERALEGRL